MAKMEAYVNDNKAVANGRAKFPQEDERVDGFREDAAQRMAASTPSPDPIEAQYSAAAPDAAAMGGAGFPTADGAGQESMMPPYPEMEGEPTSPGGTRLSGDKMSAWQYWKMQRWIVASRTAQMYMASGGPANQPNAESTESIQLQTADEVPGMQAGDRFAESAAAAAEPNVKSQFVSSRDKAAAAAPVTIAVAGKSPTAQETEELAASVFQKLAAAQRRKEEGKAAKLEAKRNKPKPTPPPPPPEKPFDPFEIVIHRSSISHLIHPEMPPDAPSVQSSPCSSFVSEGPPELDDSERADLGAILFNTALQMEPC